MEQKLKRLDGGQPPRDRRRGWMRWADLAVVLTASLLVTYFKPFAYLFGLQAFERRHGDRVELWILFAVLIVSKAIYLWGFRRSEQLAELAAVKEDVRQGRLKRMPLAARCVFLLGTLGLVCIGWYAPEPHSTKILALAVPLFLLFAVLELSTVLRPGDSVLPDPRDELLLFCRARMLKAGYVTAIVALAGLYLTSLFASQYIGLLIPIVLTVSLLVPALVYRRFDQQADSGG
jgi:hypothetical protein